jgi:hypothetical protein
MTLSEFERTNIALLTEIQIPASYTDLGAELGLYFKTKVSQLKVVV